MREEDPEAAAEDAAAAPEEAEMEDEDTRERRPLEEGALKERRNARDLPTDDMTERFLGALFGFSRSAPPLLSVLLFPRHSLPFSPGSSEGRTDFLEKISPWAWAQGREGWRGGGWLGIPCRLVLLVSRVWGKGRNHQEVTRVCS